MSVANFINSRTPRAVIDNNSSSSMQLTPFCALAHTDTGGDVALASKHFQYPNLPVHADSGDGELVSAICPHSNPPLFLPSSLKAACPQLEWQGGIYHQPHHIRWRSTHRISILKETDHITFTFSSHFFCHSTPQDLVVLNRSVTLTMMTHVTIGIKETEGNPSMFSHAYSNHF